MSLEQEQTFDLDQQQQDRIMKSRACTDNCNNTPNKTTIIDGNQKIFMSDEELARKLQAEEDQYYEQQSSQQRKQSPAINNSKTYASVVSSSQQQKTTKTAKNLSNHYQIPSTGNITSSCQTNSITTLSSHNPHCHQQSQTTKLSSTITSSGTYQQHPRTSTSLSSSTSSYHHQHKQHGHAHPSTNHQRSASLEQSVSTPVTPTTTTGIIPDDRQSVSSKRSQNKNVCF